jgi:hypothetical protein
MHLIEESYLSTAVYIPQSADEIGFEKGVVLKVILKKPDGWWKVRFFRTSVSLSCAVWPSSSCALQSKQQ